MGWPQGASTPIKWAEAQNWRVMWTFQGPHCELHDIAQRKLTFLSQYRGLGHRAEVRLDPSLSTEASPTVQLCHEPMFWSAMFTHVDIMSSTTSTRQACLFKGVRHILQALILNRGHSRETRSLTYPVTMDAEYRNDGFKGVSTSDVERFVSLTTCPKEQAAFFLEANNGDFEHALEMFYGEHIAQEGFTELSGLPPSLYRLNCLVNKAHIDCHVESIPAKLVCVPDSLACRPELTVCLKTRADQAPTTSQAASIPHPASAPQRQQQPPPPPTPSLAQRQIQRRGILGALAQLPRSAWHSGFGMVLGVVRLGAAAIAYLGSRILPGPLLAAIKGATPAHLRAVSNALPCSLGITSPGGLCSHGPGVRDWHAACETSL